MALIKICVQNMHCNRKITFTTSTKLKVQCFN